MNSDFINALKEIEKEKGISAEVLLQATEHALLTAFRKNFGSAQNARVDIEKETGEIRVFARKVVVETVSDQRLEIAIGDLGEEDAGLTLDDTVEVEVTPKNFGRIAAQAAKQVVMQQIREAERGLIYEEFLSREGDIVTGVIRRQEAKNIYIDLGRAEALLAPTEQIPSEKHNRGDRIKTYVIEVKKTTKGPQILVSRTHPGLVRRLFELEVPEIYEGIVELKAVAREPGSRSKIAVYSKDENVDPIGACVGPRGLRVQAIVNELKGEKIDIIKWDNNAVEFVANALSPAKPIAVGIDEDDKIARVTVPDHQLSLAIGKEGQNARLAARLTGWKIDIKSISQMREKEDEAAAQEQEDARPDDEEALIGTAESETAGAILEQQPEQAPDAENTEVAAPKKRRSRKAEKAPETEENDELPAPEATPKKRQVRKPKTKPEPEEASEASAAEAVEEAAVEAAGTTKSKTVRKRRAAKSAAADEELEQVLDKSAAPEESPSSEEETRPKAGRTRKRTAKTEAISNEGEQEPQPKTGTRTRKSAASKKRGSDVNDGDGENDGDAQD
jgi:N utilization substance protein A